MLRQAARPATTRDVIAATHARSRAWRSAPLPAVDDSLLAVDGRALASPLHCRRRMMTQLDVQQLSRVNGGQVFPAGGPPSNDLHSFTGERLDFRGSSGPFAGVRDYLRVTGLDHPLRLIFGGSSDR